MGILSGRFKRKEDLLKEIEILRKLVGEDLPFILEGTDGGMVVKTIDPDPTTFSLGDRWDATELYHRVKAFEYKANGDISGSIAEKVKEYFWRVLSPISIIYDRMEKDTTQLPLKQI